MAKLCGLLGFTIALLLVQMANGFPSPRSISRRRRSLELVDCTELRTGITVSSLVDEAPLRPLEVWWECASPQQGDWLGLFPADPTGVQPLPAPLASVSVDEVDGWWDTGVTAADPLDTPPSYQKTCLGRWAAYISGDNTTVRGLSCLGTEPRWMEEMQDILSSMSLTQIFLPGTHDSGSYKKFNATTATRKHGRAENIVDKYSVTQEENIQLQLVFGARYLDLRVAFYNTTPELWWINHGVVRFHPLTEVLSAVRTFVDNTNEIVVLDMHEFPVGFGKRRSISVHQLLVDFLKVEIGDLLAPPSLTWRASLSDIWASGKRVILAYNDATTVAANGDILWSAVSQKWGDVQTLEDLHSYLEGLYLNVPSGAWSAMAELTPTSLDVILDRMGGLRRMADLVNRNVTAWYKGDWGKTVNVVATDFFRGTGIVDAALEWNRRRAQAIKKNRKPLTRRR